MSGGSGYSFVSEPQVFTGYLNFGNWTVSNQATSFVVPGGGDTGATGLTEAVAGSLTITRDGTLRNLFCRHGNPAGAVNLTYTVMLNGAPTGLTLVLSSGATLGFLLGVDVPVLQGDRISFRAQNGSGVAQGVRIQAEIEFWEAA